MNPLEFTVYWGRKAAGFIAPAIWLLFITWMTFSSAALIMAALYYLALLLS